MFGSKQRCDFGAVVETVGLSVKTMEMVFRRYSSARTRTSSFYSSLDLVLSVRIYRLLVSMLGVTNEERAVFHEGEDEGRQCAHGLPAQPS